MNCPPTSSGVPAVTFVGDASQPGGMPGWHTTESDHIIEQWAYGFNGVTAYDGNYHVELNANAPSTLYQDVTSIPVGAQVGFEFAHRGRAGVDVMALTITDAGADNLFGTADDTVLFTNNYADGNTAWGHYTDDPLRPIISLGNPVRFAYTAVSAVGGPTVGNFIDDAHFGIGIGAAVPEPGSLAFLFGIGTIGVSVLRKRRK